MLVAVRNKKTGELVKKEIHDIRIDNMSIEEKKELPIGSTFYINFNEEYMLSDGFDEKADAEEMFKKIVAALN